PFSADEALAAGFVNSVVEPEDVVPTAQALAETVASKASIAIRTTKAHVAEVLKGDLSRDDARSAVHALQDPEATEARNTYLQSRR
ncbi:MAG: enoyl-CoA hydratase/isomerase family protein, partial [Actinomycetota bacterium]